MAWVENGDKSKTVTKQLFPDEEMSDTVKGWLNPTEVLDFLNRCANYKA
jgi:hypothetical protein